MRKEDVELEERTVERVYCDECGDECTDDHRYEPLEVCPDCSSDTAFSTFADFISFSDSEEPVEMSAGEVAFAYITLIIGYPVFILHFWAISHINDPDEHEKMPTRTDVYTMTVFTIATIVWGVLALAVFA